MSTPTPKIKLSQPTDIEQFDVATFNNNMKILDNLVPFITLSGKPADKPLRIWVGTVYTSTGAGGANREAKLATDSDGFGGLWPGFQGIPSFEKIGYVNISDAGGLDVHHSYIGIQFMSPTRIRFRARRMSNNADANGYASMALQVLIVGW